MSDRKEFEKQLPPLPTLLHTRVVDGVPCISVSEHEYQMREYALQAIAKAPQAEVTDAEILAVNCVSLDSDEHGNSVWVDQSTVLRFARAVLTLQKNNSPVQVPMTDREIELIDGMIAVQLDHAQRCDAIGNRVMAEKQKGWDMERVELLRRIRAYGITAQAKKETP